MRQAITTPVGKRMKVLSKPLEMQRFSCISILIFSIGCIFWKHPNLSSAQVPGTSLRFVHAVWRHGDRTPNSTFPTDPNNISAWPEGWGELTKIGMREQYRLGQYLKKRYIYPGFLSSEYNAGEIYIRSTSYNRSIMSAACNLAGMYPPTPKSTWLEGMPWQPIPVHSIPKMDDPVLYTERPCPTADNITREVWGSTEAKKFLTENAEFFAFIRNASGKTTKTPLILYEIFDPLYCELMHNKPWPSWVTIDVYHRLETLFHGFSRFYAPDPRLQRLRGGLLLGEIAGRFADKAKNTGEPSGLKYYAYSAHDVNLVVQLEIMGAYDNCGPPYASALLYELHEKQPGNFTVEVYYSKDQGLTPPTLLNVRGCGQPCYLDTFLAFAADRTPTDWYDECGLSNKDPTPRTTERSIRFESAALKAP